MAAVADRFRDRLKNRTRRQHLNKGNKEFAYPYLYIPNLADTPKGQPKHFMRFMPDHPVKNPYGYKLRAFHTVELEPGDYNSKDRNDWPKRAKVMAKEQYDDESQAEASHLINRCLDVLDTPAVLDKLDASVVAAISLLDTKIEVQFATIFYVVEGERVTDTGKVEKVWIPADPEETVPRGFVWCVTAESVYDKILDEIRVKDPHFNHIIKGRYFTFYKNHTNYDLTPEAYPDELDPRASDLLADNKYPALVKAGAKTHKTLEQCEELLMSAWWWDEVEPTLRKAFEE